MTRDDAEKNFSIGNSIGTVSGNVIGNPLWRDDAMTLHNRQLQRLAHHVGLMSRTRPGRHVMARVTEAGLNPDGASDLTTLLAQGGPGRTELLAWLARRAPGDEAITLCLLVALAPELATVCGQLVRAGVEPEDAEAETLAAAWQLVTEGPPAGSLTLSPTTLVEAVRTRTRRTFGLRRRARLEFVALDGDLEIAAPDSDPLERLPDVLGAAVAAGVLSARQEALIARSRLGGQSLPEVARAVGRSHAAVKKERKRAEESLRVFALSYDSESSSR